MLGQRRQPEKLNRLITGGIVALIVIGIMGTALLFWEDSKMKREIPFQEVIPFEKGICVVNGGKWYLDRIEVKLATINGIIKTKFYDKDGLCLFEGLAEGKEYSIEINRTDLKGRILYRKLRVEIDPEVEGARYFVLVGASVGRAWEFQKIPARLGLGNGLIFGNRTKYEFDKTSEIESLTKIPIKPSGVIIKECAAYFPRELISSKELIKKWVMMLRSSGIRPILATTVPVTKEHDNRNPGRFNSLLVFNDFIKEYASKENISVLDLEKALRIDGNDRHLRNEYAAPDGLHLVERAYREVLDGLVMPTIDQMNRVPPPKPNL